MMVQIVDTNGEGDQDLITKGGASHGLEDRI